MFWCGKQDSAGSNLSIVFFYYFYYLLFFFFSFRVDVWKCDEKFIFSQHRVILFCQNKLTNLKQREQKVLNKYSRTSVARTLMARLPRLLRTRS